MSNILILTGSARANGNTMALANAFAAAAERNGHSIIRYHAADLHSPGCQGCCACYRNANRRCVFDEGFNQFAADLEQSDVFVISSPVYWYSFPAQLKAVLDKFNAFTPDLETMGVKKCVLLAAAGEPEVTAFDSMISTYDQILAGLGWISVGEVLQPGVFEIGDIEKTNALQRAEQLAKQL